MSAGIDILKLANGSKAYQMYVLVLKLGRNPQTVWKQLTQLDDWHTISEQLKQVQQLNDQMANTRKGWWEITWSSS
jgi:Zn-dependent M32 family carboxypeptidase